jgi:transcriptional regulator with XRE-family HTH domain
VSQVTLRSIAEATGLSIGTVSRALKNQAGMTEVTRNKVREAALRLGYDFAQLKKGRIRRIAFLLHSQHNTLASSPFFSPVLHGAEEACRREGIALSFIAVGPAEPVLGQIRLHQPDAIVCAGFFEPEVLAALQQVGKPIVLVDMHRRGFTSVNPDNLRGGYLATQHLLRCGRKRIAMLSGSLAHYSIQQRNRGFRQALFDAKVHADPDLEVIVPTMGDADDGVVEAQPARPAEAARCGLLLQRQHGAGGHEVLPERGAEGPARHRHCRFRRHRRRRRRHSSAQHHPRGQGSAGACRGRVVAPDARREPSPDHLASRNDRARKQLR